MKLSPVKTAEAGYREAFERLKIGSPKNLPHGSQLSQNNVAKEAGCDPSALRKARFPSLVSEIQNYLAAQGDVRSGSVRQTLLKQRRQSRGARETISDLKKQRDAAAGLLIEANAQIGILTRRLRDVEARMEDLLSRNQMATLTQSKAKASPRTMDTIQKK